MAACSPSIASNKCTQPFEPITTDAGGDRILFVLQIGVQETVAEMPHRQARCDDVVPEALVTLIAGGSGDQLVGTPSEPAKLFRSGGNVGRFVEPDVITDE